MFTRKWVLTLVLANCLLIPCATQAQTNGRLGGRTVIPQRERVAVASVSLIPQGKRVVVVGVFPNDANEFQNIYRREPTYTEAIDMAKTQRQLARVNQPSLKFHPEARTKSGFESLIRQAEEQTIIVAGHNEKGEFRFADGSSLNLTKIDTLLKEHNKQAIVLSCAANDYVLPGSPAATGTLTNRDAIRMIDSIGKDFGRGTPPLGDAWKLEGNFTNRVQANIHRIETLSNIESILKTTAETTAFTGTLVGTGYAIDWKVRTRKR